MAQVIVGFVLGAASAASALLLGPWLRAMPEKRRARARSTQAGQAVTHQTQTQSAPAGAAHTQTAPLVAEQTQTQGVAAASEQTQTDRTRLTTEQTQTQAAAGSTAAGSTQTAAASLSSGAQTAGSSDRASELLPRVSKSSPNPDWHPGQKQPHPYGPDAPLLAIDPDTTDVGSIYALGISAVVPRPVAFITSYGADGSRNLSPFSYFNLMHQNPPVVTIGISRSGSRGGNMKDTHQNIVETKEFVISIISEWYIEAANHTCGDYARGVDEAALTGLTPLPSIKVKPPGVAESVVNLECKLLHTYDMADKRNGKPTGTVLVAEVVLFRVNEAATMQTPTGKVVMDPLKLLPVCRLGGHTYGRVAGMFDIARPDGEGHYPPKST